MARPSLPAAIAPFRGCPAGCLRVACETLSPSAEKGRMNNDPRQALALNNPFPCFTLLYFLRPLKQPQAIPVKNLHSFIHPVLSNTAISFKHRQFSLLPSLVSYLKTCSRFCFASAFLIFHLGNNETNAQSRWRAESSTHLSGFSGPHLTLPIALIIKTRVTHPRLPCHSPFERALLDLSCLKGPGPN